MSRSSSRPGPHDLLRYFGNGKPINSKVQEDLAVREAYQLFSRRQDEMSAASLEEWETVSTPIPKGRPNGPNATLQLFTRRVTFAGDAADLDHMKIIAKNLAEAMRDGLPDGSIDMTAAVRT